MRIRTKERALRLTIEGRDPSVAALLGPPDIRLGSLAHEAERERRVGRAWWQRAAPTRDRIGREDLNEVALDIVHHGLLP